MPFSSVSELPDNIKKLSGKKQRQFMSVFNGAFASAKKSGKSTKDAESSAFAQAHGVVNKASPDVGDSHVDGLVNVKGKKKKQRPILEKFVEIVHSLRAKEEGAEPVAKRSIIGPDGEILPHDVEREDTFESHTTERTEYREEGTKTTGERTSRSTFSTEIVIKSIDKREWIIYGVVMEPTAQGGLVNGTFIGKVDDTDAHDHFTTVGEIRKAMIGFMQDLHYSQAAPHNIQHDNTKEPPSTIIIENYQAPVDFELGGALVLKGSWVQGTKINDPSLREAIESGAITGYSIEGRGLLSEVA